MNLSSFLGIWGPKIIGVAIAVMIVVQNGLMNPCTATVTTNCGLNWQNVLSAALSAAFGFMVKGYNVTGGTVANPTAAPGTVPDNLAPPKT